MINIPLIFWLVLISPVYGGSNTSIIPIPFSTLEDCVIAGKNFANGGWHSYRCLQQRKNDVYTFQGWANGGTENYHQ